jgi:hypothetical protein
MGKVNYKIYAVDTDYSDFFQAAINLNQQKKQVSPVNTTFVDADDVLQKINIDFPSGRESNTTPSYGGLLETIEVKAIPGAFVTKHQFLNYFASRISGSFSNHYLEMNIPQKVQSNNSSDFSYSLKSKYNYYVRNYEEQIINKSERTLPNYYVQDSIHENNKAFIRPNIEETFKLIGNKISINYPARNNEELENIIISDSKFIQSKAEEYPMYIEGSFYNGVRDNAFEFLNESGLIDNLIQDFRSESNTTQRSFDINFSTGVSKVETFPNYKVFSLLGWLENQNYQQNDGDSLAISPKGYSSFYSFRMKKMIMIGIIKNIVKKYLRSYEEVLSNAPCYSQVLFYKVDKYVGNIIGNPAQTLWISSPEDMISFVDTQIKHQQIYSYDIKAITVVVGNTYSFGNIRLSDSDKEFTAQIDVNNRPSVQIVEIPYIIDRTSALQNPPMIPQVKFSTKKDGDPSLQITLNRTIGSSDSIFLPIETIDTTQRNLMELTKNNFSLENKLFFESGDYPEYFEIYRVFEKPKSYADFTNNKLKDAKMYLQKTRQNPSKITINDFVVPNHKYYYMFRSVNAHELKSNPTIVYEVELIRDSDDSKVTVKPFIFEDPPAFQNTIDFTSLFQVEPVFEQTFFDNDQPGLFNKTSADATLANVKLGIADESIWGRTFKIRMTSKTTGKMIDFNVKFDLLLSKTDK